MVASKLVTRHSRQSVLDDGPAVLGLCLGLALGILLWTTLLRLLPTSSAALEQARALGLVSFTIRAGYDPGQEGRAWLLACLIVPFFGWLGSRLASRPSRDGAVPIAAPALPRIPPWVPWVALWAAALLSLRPALIFARNPWGSFGLLGEEGVYLGAVQALRTGRGLYSELSFPYGPLLILPMDLWLRVVGDTVAAARTWVLLMHGLGVLLVGLSGALAVGGRRGPWIGAAAALLAALLGPAVLPTLNGVMLRPALAFLPAALLLAAARQGPDAPERARSLALLGGAAVVLGGLLSFEIGAAALLGGVVALLLGRAGRSVWLPGVLGGLVVGTVALTLMAFFGCLGGWLDQAREMLILPALGYQALPYPDSFGLFLDGDGARGSYPPDDLTTALWALLVPLVLWVSLARGLRAVRGTAPPVDERRAVPTLVMALIGAFLFRAALGRSDLYHLWFYGTVPLALLAPLLAELYWDTLPSRSRLLLPAALLLLGLSMAALDVGGHVAFPDEEERRLARSPADQPVGERALSVPRAGGIHTTERLADAIEQWLAVVAALPEEDGLWFYPSEATLYFLADRPLPDRYLWAYDAATPAMQRRAIDELERAPPRWLLRSLDTFPIDWIPQRELVPLIERYIDEHYEPRRELRGGLLMERRRARSWPEGPEDLAKTQEEDEDEEPATPL